MELGYENGDGRWKQGGRHRTCIKTNHELERRCRFNNSLNLYFINKYANMLMKIIIIPL